MKKNIVKLLSVILIAVSFTQKSHAVDIVIAPSFIFHSNGANYPGVMTDTAAEAIRYATSPIGVILGVLIIPLAILSEDGKVLKPGVTLENLLAQGYTTDEIEQYDRDQHRIFQVVGGKRMTVQQFKQTLENLNLAESSRQILGL